jgi:pimeloyl-ACP methyl ester carboxylesterase
MRNFTPWWALALALVLATSLAAADVTCDGARVHYESYGKGKDAVVFIHGWTCDLTFWRGQAPVYEKRRSLLIDLPGHGQSDKPDVPYTQERFARAIEAVMRDAGVERAALVGHSMGGPVGITFLRLFPAKAQALVLVDAFVPQAPKDDAERERQKTQVDNFLQTWRGPKYKEAAEKMIASMFSDKTTPAMREEIRAKMTSAPQHVMVSAFEGMFAMQAPKPGETYSLPVMAVVVQTPGRAGYEAQLRTVFPNLRKYEGWEGSGHFLMMESPDRFNRALEDFLGTLK